MDEKTSRQILQEIMYAIRYKMMYKGKRAVVIDYSDVTNVQHRLIVSLLV